MNAITQEVSDFITARRSAARARRAVVQASQGGARGPVAHFAGGGRVLPGLIKRRAAEAALFRGEA